MIGIRVTLRDEGEGWFPEYTNQSISGRVERVIASHDGDSPFYLVRLDVVLELQEKGYATPSGYGLNRYSHVVILSRWKGVDVQANQSVSVYVFLVREGVALPVTLEDVQRLNLRIWADCCAAPVSNL